MNHFSIEDWADFDRHVAPDDLRETMQRHLDEGCESCANIVQMWSKVVAAGIREASFEPPDSAIRWAKALYVLVPPQEAKPGLIEIARLVFDSLRQPVFEGVRGTGPSSCQLLFKSKNLMVDMRIESQPASNRVSLTGQVLDPLDATKHYDGTRIVLARGQERLTETVSNQFGEFQFEFTAGNDLQIVINLANNTFVVFPLPLSAQGTGRFGSQPAVFFADVPPATQESTPPQVRRSPSEQSQSTIDPPSHPQRKLAGGIKSKDEPTA